MAFGFIWSSRVEDLVDAEEEKVPGDYSDDSDSSLRSSSCHQLRIEEENVGLISLQSGKLEATGLDCSTRILRF